MYAVHVELLLMRGTAEEELFELASSSWICSEKDVAAAAAAEARAGSASGGGHIVEADTSSQTQQRSSQDYSGVQPLKRVALEKRGIRNLFFLHLKKVS